ncbi:serine/threonine-protein phosphatase [Actinoallomurus spadix]|uniref:PP2C family protein-serine/threonine phosphatase n=1 Tax=Actinoallomurus spadix TaxID=79912 RepID=A0ABP3GDI5_9ACTN|nr:PP2C family protein-serine/threonine phosphatase [Actinoallomurus spadix]MCO5984734.1 serine/threonine-protein phosphatase [Actinoallomurus spadix]
MSTGEAAGLSVGERILADILREARCNPPNRLAEVVLHQARPLGITRVVVYLADLQETVLVPLPCAADPGTDTGLGDEVDVDVPGDGTPAPVRGVEPIGHLTSLGDCTPAPGMVRIEGTVAGLAYRRLTVVTAEEGDAPGDLTGVDAPVRRHRVWLPLVDGTVRLGVLELALDRLGEQVLQRCHLLAGVVALLVASHGIHSDAFARLRRRERMELSAEMVWAFMPGHTLATKDVVISAAAEPAYRLGGDAYDFSTMDTSVHMTVLDAAGHDLVAGLVASVGLASCRSTRRAGGGLAEIATVADRAIREHSPEWRFMTGLLLNLETETGRLEWVNCGHPPPLLIRKDKVIKELARTPDPPMGLLEGTRPRTHHETLQPGDRLLCYTDGVIEARTRTGELFGVERLADTILRTTAAGMSTPEALRRLVHGLLAEHGAPLADDATIMLAEWRPTTPGGAIQLTPQTTLPMQHPER